MLKEKENIEIELEDVLRKFCDKYNLLPRVPLHDIANATLSDFVENDTHETYSQRLKRLRVVAELQYIERR